MADLPWFPLYAGDWLSSQTVQLLTLKQEGAFFRLLCYAWLSPTGALPKHEGILKRLCKWEEGEEFGPVLACFHSHPDLPDLLINRRLMKERELSRQRQQLMSERGHKGAEARWSEKPKKLKTQKAVLLANGRDYLAESKEVLAFLNEKTQKHFREVDGTLHFIQARLKSGVDVQTCRTLIMRKIHDWKEKPDMQTYLRPETLFNKTKFEGYLAEVTK